MAHADCPVNGQGWRHSWTSGGSDQHSHADWRTASEWPSHQSWWQQQQPWWQCGVCQAWNQGAKKKCQSCGCKRSVAMSAGQGTKAAGEQHAQQSRGAEIRQQLQQLQDRVVPLTQGPGPETVVKMEPASAARDDIGTELTQLRQSLASLPQGSHMDSSRAAIQARITELNKQIRPQGAQLDTCRDAIARARRRREEADEIIALTQAVRQQAIAEEEKLKDDLCKLSAAVLPSDAQPNSVTSMNASLAKVLSDMREGQAAGKVAPEAIAEAEKLMSTLSQGIEQISLLAREAAVGQVGMTADSTTGRERPPQSAGDSPIQEPPLARVRLNTKTSPGGQGQAPPMPSAGCAASEGFPAASAETARA